MIKQVKKYFLVILCSLAIMPAMRANGVLSAIAGYTVLDQKGSNSPFWLTIPALIGGWAAYKATLALYYTCSKEAKKSVKNAVKADMRLKRNNNLSQNQKDQMVGTIAKGLMHEKISGYLASAVQILATAATAYGLAVMK